MFDRKHVYTRRFDANAGSTASPSIPPSLRATTSDGWASTRLTPPIQAATRPTRSVNRSVPSGVNARSHGRFRPVANEVTDNVGAVGAGTVVTVVVVGPVGGVDGTHDAATSAAIATATPKAVDAIRVRVMCAPVLTASPTRDQKVTRETSQQTPGAVTGVHHPPIRPFPRHPF